MYFAHHYVLHMIRLYSYKLALLYSKRLEAFKLSAEHNAFQFRSVHARTRATIAFAVVVILFGRIPI